VSIDVERHKQLPPEQLSAIATDLPCTPASAG
jgi:hypothetical protein